MSEDPIPTRTHAITPQKDNSAAKWLIGAGAAVLLLGGGYLAWKNLGPSAVPAQTAYNDPYAAETGDASSYDATATAPIAETASAEDDVVRAAPAPAAAPAPRSTPRSTTRTAAVPEQTIGVTPASVTTDDEDIVVPAPRRPVWAHTPSARRLTAMYPARALERGREGEAQLHCMVEERGQLDCDRVSETPGGFGPAAVRVARSFRHAERLPDGRSAIGTPVNLRVVFRIEDQRGQRYASR